MTWPETQHLSSESEAEKLANLACDKYKRYRAGELGVGGLRTAVRLARVAAGQDPNYKAIAADQDPDYKVVLADIIAAPIDLY